jgi:hypothetical protein
MHWDAKTGKPLRAVGMWIAVIVERYDFHFFSRSIKYFEQSDIARSWVSCIETSKSRTASF